MIVALFLLVLIQDGPIRTAPVVDAPQEGAAAPAAPADPGPRCTFGGRPVRSPGCPTPQVSPAAEDDEDENPWDILTQAGLAQANAGEGGYSRPLRISPADEDGVPAWAFTDPARWEIRQCGSDGDAVCRRQARNRLAMARAGLADEAPAPAARASAPPRCRMEMRRAEDGFGGSVSRVCGDGDAASDALDRLQESAIPAARVESCDRPASYENQAAWIARCRSLPPR